LETQLKERDELAIPSPTASALTSPTKPQSRGPSSDNGSFTYVPLDRSSSSVSGPSHVEGFSGDQMAKATMNGPLSMPRFCARMRTYLSELLPDVLLPAEPWLPNLSLEPKFCSHTDENLTRLQENHLLDLFWHSYHSLTPIVNMLEFKAYHDSLWSNPSLSDHGKLRRKPSPLLDIMLALCLQHDFVSDRSYALAMRVEELDNIGQQFYQRCQALLTSQPEASPILEVRCHVYSCIYMLNAGQYDNAYWILAKTVKLAKSLELQREPRANVPQSQKYMMKRIWWTLVFLDTRICLTLDRPYLTEILEPSMPTFSNDIEEAQLYGAEELSSHAGLSYLTFHSQCIQLALGVRGLQTAMRHAWNEALADSTEDAIYADASKLESCASALLPRVKRLTNWQKGVPEALKLPRQGSAAPFSTSKSPIEHDIYIPLWLQRQRIHLELLYHNFLASLLHPFIRFATSAASGVKNHGAPIATGHGVMALNHALVTTSISTQLFTETDLLNHWHNAYQFQGDAVVVLLGFVIAHPICTFTASARKAIYAAIENLGNFSQQGLKGACSVVALIRDWTTKIDQITEKFHSGSFSSTRSSDRSSISSSSMSSTALTPPALLEDLSQQHSSKSTPLASNSHSPLHTVYPFSNSSALNQQAMKATSSSTQMPLLGSEDDAMQKLTAYPTRQFTFADSDFSTITSQLMLSGSEDISMFFNEDISMEDVDEQLASLGYTTYATDEASLQGLADEWTIRQNTAWSGISGNHNVNDGTWNVTKL
jgi:hypothetical protein